MSRHVVLVRIIAFRTVRSFRMQSGQCDFLGLAAGGGAGSGRRGPQRIARRARRATAPDESLVFQRAAVTGQGRYIAAICLRAASRTLAVRR
jgi:hypothetical protein